MNNTLKVHSLIELDINSSIQHATVDELVDLGRYLSGHNKDINSIEFLFAQLPVDDKKKIQNTNLLEFDFGSLGDQIESRGPEFARELVVGIVDSYENDIKNKLIQDSDAPVMAARTVGMLLNHYDGFTVEGTLFLDHKDSYYETNVNFAGALLYMSKDKIQKILNDIVTQGKEEFLFIDNFVELFDEMNIESVLNNKSREIYNNFKSINSKDIDACFIGIKPLMNFLESKRPEVIDLIMQEDPGLIKDLHALSGKKEQSVSGLEY